ncbi:MAG: exonuclease SbcCD subunit D [Lachnospiraceae bacterium]|nr:exonuclease SbcCD subunit D [Lachnospiraceae bacterium]
MKLIHLSDLHLGKRVNEFSMIEDQEYILKEIITIIKEERPDGVMVAGDVYDRVVPSEEAMKLWDGFLIRMAKEKIPVYAISGNHDSAIRFADHSALVEANGIHLSPEYDRETECCTVEDEYGRVHIYLLPFIKPAVVRAVFPEEEIRDYTDACRVAVEHMAVDVNERNILIAHQTIIGASHCDSELAVVCGVDGVEASVFDDFDYVALGHLHGKQRAGRDEVRYCGSPLKYSFSEAGHVKSLTVVELKEKGQVEIGEIELRPKRDLREIRGSYEEIMNKRNYEGTNTEDYVHIKLTDENDIVDAISKIRVVYPHIMKLSYDNRRTGNQEMLTDAENVNEKAPLELFEEFYEKQNNQKMTEEQRKFSEALIEAVWGKEGIE